jgi:hypothetical protein
VEHAGIGSLELHTWIAAAAANAAAGGAPPVKDIYAEALEYGIAFGMVHAGISAASIHRQAVKT